MNIVLYLMNEKGKATLENICEYFQPSIIRAVISSKDHNVQNDYYHDIYDLCTKYNISFFDRHEKPTFDQQAYFLAIGWRWLIEPKDNLIIFHDSLLPRYRGFAPLVNALINGDLQIGVTALFAHEQYDTGDIILQKSLTISYPITISQAITKIISLYQILAIEIILAIQTNSLKTTPQKHEDATYSIWRDEEDYHINWNESADKIVRFINALGYPYTGAFSWMDGNKVFIMGASEVTDVKLELRHVGKIIFIDEDAPVVIAGSGLVKITKMINSNGHDLLPLKNFRVRFK